LAGASKPRHWIWRAWVPNGADMRGTTRTYAEARDAARAACETLGAGRLFSMIEVDGECPTPGNAPPCPVTGAPCVMFGCMGADGCVMRYAAGKLLGPEPAAPPSEQPAEASAPAPLICTHGTTSAYCPHCESAPPPRTEESLWRAATHADLLVVMEHELSLHGIPEAPRTTPSSLARLVTVIRFWLEHKAEVARLTRERDEATAAVASNGALAQKAQQERDRERARAEAAEREPKQCDVVVAPIPVWCGGSEGANKFGCGMRLSHEILFRCTDCRTPFCREHALRHFARSHHDDAKRLREIERLDAEAAAVTRERDQARAELAAAREHAETATRLHSQLARMCAELGGLDHARAIVEAAWSWVTSDGPIGAVIDAVNDLAALRASPPVAPHNEGEE
jgi:hypothetical protein